MSQKTADDNYLDFIPSHMEGLDFTINDKKEITLLVENKGLFNKIGQKFFHKPKVSQIHLDEMGNFIWPLIDGHKTVYDISECVKAEFGEKAEPLYKRLLQYCKTLESYHFIVMKKS